VTLNLDFSVMIFLTSNNSKVVHDTAVLTWHTDRKSCVVYCMVTFSVTLISRACHCLMLNI